MKISHFRDKNKMQNIEQRNIRNLKFSDLNKYINNVHNINIRTNRINEGKPKNQSLNNYFNLNKIKKEKKSIDNSLNKFSINNKKNHVNRIYNDINIYHRSFIENKKENSYRNKKINKFSETERMINKDDFNNNNNNDINKKSKEKKLLKLKNILERLKSENNEINNDLKIIIKQNSELEQSENNKKKNIYINIKNILDNINIKNKINFNKNIYNSLSIEEKSKFIQKKYLDEKLQQTFIEKMFSVYHNLFSSVNEADIITGNDYNLHNLLNWVISLKENINLLKMKNDEIKYEINATIKEKEIFKNYYNKWENILGTNSSEKMIQNINELIKEQNINKNEKNKMIKMLFNQKK